MTKACAGFTAIELVIAMTIIALLAAISTPAVLRAAQNARLSGAADAILRVHREARLLAMTRPQSAATVGKRYGVAVVVPADGPAYASVLLGDDANDVLMADDDGDGVPDSGANARPLVSSSLPGGIEILTATGASDTAVAFTGTLLWFYDWRTGAPMETAVSSNPVSIGTRGAAAQATQFFTSAFGTNDILALARPLVPPSPVCSELAVANRGSTSPRVRVAIYNPGLGWRSDPETP